MGHSILQTTIVIFWTLVPLGFYPVSCQWGDIGPHIKAQVTLCRSGGPDLYDLKNRGHRHGRLMKSWQHLTGILEVCSVGKRSAMIGKPVRQSFTVKLCRVGRDCGYDLFMDRFQSCVESETSWDCRTQREGIRGQRVGIRGQRTDGREDWTNITIASCLIGVTLTF